MGGQIGHEHEAMSDAKAGKVRGQAGGDVQSNAAVQNTTLPPGVPTPQSWEEHEGAAAAGAVVTNVSNNYPKAMYRPDGHFDTAADPAEEQLMLEQGWSARFVAPRSPQIAQGNVQASGLDPLAMLIREVLESVLDERGLGEPRKARAPFGTQPMQWIGARDKHEAPRGKEN
jgi:hypothetical protein